MAQRSDQYWGIEGYEVPKQDFDHNRHAQQTENMLIACGKKKSSKGGSINPKAERGGLFKVIEKRSISVPSPWNYNIPGLFESDPKDNPPSYVPPNRLQQIKFRWQNVPKEQQTILRPVKRKPEKLDAKVKKHTFVEQIIHENTKENYPIPGPGSYFLTQTAIKRFYKDHVDLLTKKNEEDVDVRQSLPYHNQKRKATILFFRPRKSGDAYSGSRLLPTRRELTRLPSSLTSLRINFR